MLIDLKIIFLSSLFLGLLTWVLPIQAATISWQEIKTDDPQQLILRLYLDTEGSRENAWSGQINFDPQQLKLQSISDAQSLVSLWLDRPGESLSGQINFSGITPGSFGGTGEIFRLIFNLTGDLRKTARSSISLTNFEALLGNGSGQTDKVLVAPTMTIITDNSIMADSLVDKTAPELFWQITDTNLISAYSSDKQSGVRYLALATTSNYFGPFGGLIKLNSRLNWQKITGPQILTRSELNHTIFIKTVDNAGNAKIIKLYPIRTYLIALFCIIIIGLILCLFLWTEGLFIGVIEKF